MIITLRDIKTGIVKSIGLIADKATEFQQRDHAQKMANQKGFDSQDFYVATQSTGGAVTSFNLKEKTA